MRKALMVILALLLWNTAATAQEEEAKLETSAQESFDADIGLGGWFVWTSKNAAEAAKYEYLHSSAAGSLNMEWDTLPHRFVVDSYYLNKKNYFGDVDYSWKDVVVMNVLIRDMFRNLPHLNIGADDPSTPLPSFTDRNPLDEYGTEERISRAFLRFKMPDYPFHIYAEAREVVRQGDLQQRFLDVNNLFPPAKVSESRELTVRGLEVTVGANSHLGPVELDYNHSQKKVDVSREKVLTDPFLAGPFSYEHNLVPDLESSADSIKMHTSYTGRLVAAATVTTGDKKNKDGMSKADYSMAAGDVTFIPVNDLALFLKYRHYDLDLNNPDSVVATTMLGPVTYSARNSISSQRDVVIGAARYRVTSNLWVRVEYDVESLQRDVGIFGTNLTPPPVNTPAWWNLPKETVKSTARAAMTYRVAKTVMIRADYSHLTVDNPAYETDPDKGDYAKATITWSPAKILNVAVGYNGARETRALLDGPLAGGDRKSSRDQAFGSVTLLLGRRSSVTATYAYIRNNVDQGITFQDGTGASVLDPTVPYTDRSQSGSVAVTHSPMDGVTLTLEAKRSDSDGSFRPSGGVAGTNGIGELSDLKLVESDYNAEIAVQYTKQLGYEIRYQYATVDDKLDETQDGTAQMLLATVTMKW